MLVRWPPSISGVAAGRIASGFDWRFGVDAFAFACGFSKVYHVECDESLSRLVARNARALALEDKFDAIHADGIQWLDSQKCRFDVCIWIRRRDIRG